MTWPPLLKVMAPLALRDVARQVETVGADAVAGQIVAAVDAVVTPGERRALGALMSALAARWPQ